MPGAPLPACHPQNYLRFDISLPSPVFNTYIATALPPRRTGSARMTLLLCLHAKHAHCTLKAEALHFAAYYLTHTPFPSFSPWHVWLRCLFLTDIPSVSSLSHHTCRRTGSRQWIGRLLFPPTCYHIPRALLLLLRLLTATFTHLLSISGSTFDIYMLHAAAAFCMYALPRAATALANNLTYTICRNGFGMHNISLSPSCADDSWNCAPLSLFVSHTFLMVTPFIYYLLPR